MTLTGYLLSSSVSATVTTTTDALGIQLQATQAAQITGSVTDASTSLPIPNAVVECTGTTTGDTFQTQTAADGSYSFDTLPADTYTVLVSADGHVSSSIVGIAAALGQTSSNQNFSLLAGATITGTVSSQVGAAPIAGAAILAQGQATDYTLAAVTAADGTYSLAGVPADTYTIIANATGFARTFQANVAITSGSHTLSLTMVPESVITGSVNPAVGGPIGGTLQVMAQPVGVTDPNQDYFASITNNSFSLNGLPAGSYDLSISLPGYLPATLTTVTVAGGATVNVAVINLSLAASISGTVQSTDPTVPAANEAVGLYSGTTLVESTTTDSNGAFGFTGVSPGTYTASLVQASPSALETDPTVTVAAGGNITSADISIVPGGVIAGQATDTISGHPLANVTVSLANSGGAVSTTTSDANGDFQFSHLTAGTYVVQLPLNGTNATQTASVTALDGTVVTANLSDAFSGELTGVVSDAQANPLANVAVALLQSGQVIDSQVTDGTGRYLFYLVNSGTYSLQVSSDTASFPQIAAFQVPSGATVTENIQAGNGSIQVTSADSVQPVTGDTMALYLDASGNEMLAGLTTVDASGVTTFTNLVGGAYTIEVNGPTNRGGTATTTLAGGSQQSVHVNLLQQVSLSGVISDSLGNALSGVYVELVSSLDSSIQRSTQTGSDGTYSISNLDAGTYYLTAFLDGYMPVVNQTVVVSGSTTFNGTLSASTTTISGKVESADGSPVANAAAVIFGANGQPIAAETTAGDGTFKTTSALGMNSVLVVGKQGYTTSAPLQINITSGATMNIGTITIQPASVGDPSSAGSFSISVPIWIANIASQVKAYISQLFPSPTAGMVPPVPAWQQNLTNLHQQVLSAISTRDAVAAQLRQAAGNVIGQSAKTGLAFLLDDAVLAGTFASIALSLATLSTEIAAAEVFGLVSTEVATAALSVVSGVVGIYYQTKAEWQAITGSTSDADAKAKAGAAVEGSNNFYSVVSGAANWFKTSEVGAVLAGKGGNVLGSVLGVINIWLNDPFKDGEAQGAILDSDVQIYNGDFNNYQTDCGTATQLFNQYISALEPAPPGPPPTPPTNPGPTGTTHILISNDPNALIGPVGYGTQGFIQPTGTWPYTVDFENDGTTAALGVTVTQQLNANLDWSTFQLGSFGFGSTIVTVPAGLTQYQTTVSYENSDASPLNVAVSLDFNVETGLLTATFTSLDPTTGQAPAGVFDGFLPPDNASGAGEGFVEFTLKPSGGLSTGAVINAQATVVFDTNVPLNTAQITNTIDSGAPASSVAPLPATETSTNFTVHWSGQDDAGGSGVASYTVYVSDDGGTPTIWQNSTAGTSATFTGQAGHSYGFYSVATDNVGNVEPTPADAQAGTTPVLPLTGSLGVYQRRLLVHQRQRDDAGRRQPRRLGRHYPGGGRLERHGQGRNRALQQCHCHVVARYHG